MAQLILNLTASPTLTCYYIESAEQAEMTSNYKIAIVMPNVIHVQMHKHSVQQVVFHLAFLWYVKYYSF